MTSNLVSHLIAYHICIDDEETVAVTKQILKGLNTIVLRIATETPTDKSLCVLLPLLTKCCMVKHGVLEVCLYRCLHYTAVVFF